MKLALTTLAALLAHLLIGWWATPFVALAGGAWRGRGGWWLGLVALALEWGGIVLYSFFRDGAAFGRMTTTVGGLLGNLPHFAVVAATLAIAGVLGLLGGHAGTQIRHLSGR